MVWIRIAITAWMALSSISAINMVGKHREPLDGATAALATLAAGLIIWGVWTL